MKLRKITLLIAGNSRNLSESLPLGNDVVGCLENHLATPVELVEEEEAEFRADDSYAPVWMPVRPRTIYDGKE